MYCMKLHPFPLPSLLSSCRTFCCTQWQSHTAFHFWGERQRCPISTPNWKLPQKPALSVSKGIKSAVQPCSHPWYSHAMLSKAWVAFCLQRRSQNLNPSQHFAANNSENKQAIPQQWCHRSQRALGLWHRCPGSHSGPRKSGGQITHITTGTHLLGRPHSRSPQKTEFCRREKRKRSIKQHKMWFAGEMQAVCMPVTEFPNSTVGCCLCGKEGLSSGRSGVFTTQEEEMTTQAPQLDDFKGLAELYLFHVSFTGAWHEKHPLYLSDGGKFSMEIQYLELGAVWFPTPATSLRGLRSSNPQLAPSIVPHQNVSRALRDNSHTNTPRHSSPPTPSET